MDKSFVTSALQAVSVNNARDTLPAWIQVAMQEWKPWSVVWLSLFSYYSQWQKLEKIASLGDNWEHRLVTERG